MAQGRYFYLQSALNGLVLDISGGCDAGSPVQTQFYEENKETQLWYDDIIHDVIRSKCDDEYVMAMTDKVIVNKFDANAESQKWHHFQKRRLLNLATLTSLDIYEGNADPGATITCWKYGDTPNQHWSKVYVEPKVFLLRSRLHGKCLDVKGGEECKGADIILWPEHGGENQQWYEGRDGTIYSKLNRLALDSGDDDHKFELKPYDGTLACRQWVRLGHTIVNCNEPDLCMQIKDHSEDDEAEVMGGQYFREPYQEWDVVWV